MKEKIWNTVMFMSTRFIIGVVLMMVFEYMNDVLENERDS